MFLRNYKFTIILVLVILVVVGYAGWKWYGIKMNLVEQGLADPRFPYHEYSLLELAGQGRFADLNDEDRAKLEQQLKNLPTRTTPQETFDKYIQALKDGDIERALNYIEKEDYIEYREDDPWRPVHYRISEQDRKHLNNIKEEGKLGDIIKDLEKIRAEIINDIGKIKRGSTGELEVRYKYRCRFPENEPCHLFFTKDLWGDWKLYDSYL